ncbi:MAG: ATP-binding protein, partial [Rhodothermales bacterium]
VPVLLNILPVHSFGDDRKLRVDAVTVAGEVLREPATWTQSQTQRNRLETLGRMTMGIAHDFNNLLSGILGYTELLKSYVEEEKADPVLADHLRTIEQAALDGAALIRKIQQYIRQEKLTHFTPLDVPTLIQDCIALTRPYWYNEPRRLGIAISVEEDFEEVPPVMGSATELREVFLNLILNAVQAMPKGGTLIFKTDLAEAGVRVTVSDTGLGMSDNVRQHIFEPLYTTKGDRGTGMGLAVSYGIIQEHEGTIKVESGLGEGSTFVMTFPPAEDSSPERKSEPEKKPGRTARILVVDDERMVRTILVKLLSLKGHDVEQAASGSEALSIMDAQEFDLVFTDLGMPEMNGRQLARVLRRKRPDLPIVLLTGDTEVGEPGDDVDVVMAKPFKIDQLERTIQDLLQVDSPDV